MKIIKVQLNETIETICQREYNSVNFVKDLALFNHIKYPQHIYPNMELWIPTKQELKHWIESGGEK